jgi:hypothetical protein
MKLLKLSFLRILVVAILLLSGASENAEVPKTKLPVGSNEPKTQPGKQSGPAQTFPQPTTAAAPVIIINSPAPAIEQNRAEAKSEKWPPTPLEVISIITAFGAFVIAWRTLNAVRRQATAAEQTLTLIGKQADAAIHQARAAKDGAYAAKQSADASILSQRAQIFASPTKQYALRDARNGGQPEAAFLIRNVGMTPAYKCTYRKWAELVDEPFDYVLLEEANDVSETDPGVTIFPNDPYPPVVFIGLPRALTEQDMLAWQNGTKELWFRVRYRYKDVFGEDRWADFGYAYERGNVQSPKLLPQYHNTN